MAQLNVRRSYAAGEPLLKGDLDAFIDDIETFINITKLNNDNIQDAGIDASAKIIDNTFAGEKFVNGAVTTAKILDANVTTAKIADGAVTTAKLNDLAVTTAKIADNAVTLPKLADGSITFDKMAEGSSNGSIASDTRPTTQPGFVFTKEVELTLTTVASDAYVIIEGVSGYFQCYHTSSSASAGTDSIGVNVLISRKLSGATTANGVANFSFTAESRVATTSARYDNSISATLLKLILPSPGAGTYVYSIYIAPTSANSVDVSNCVFNIRKLSK